MVRRTLTFLLLSGGLATTAACWPDASHGPTGGMGGAGSTGTISSSGGNGGSSVASGGSDSGSSTSTMSGSSSSSGTSQACVTYASTQCSQLMTCAPDWITAYFGTMAACQSRFELDCSLQLGAPGTGWTEARMGMCASAVGALDCDQYLLALVDVHGWSGADACSPQGTLLNGQTCVDSGQCASGYCQTDTGNGIYTCGVCKPLSGVGQPCHSVLDCQAGLACPAASGACAQPFANGTPCAMGGRQCADGSYCQNDVCSPALEANAACNANTTCNLVEGLYCDGVCSHATYNPAGSPCGFVGGAAFRCSAGGMCYSNKCIAPAADGAACNPSVGKNCTLPALCTDGICKLPIAGLCP